MVGFKRSLVNLPGLRKRPGDPGLSSAHIRQAPVRMLAGRLGWARILAVLASLVFVCRADGPFSARAANGDPFTLAWSSYETDTTTCVAWGDYDGDGDLDLAVGNNGQPNQLYRNDGLKNGVLQMTLVWSSAEADYTTSLAWGDYDNDGDLDLAVGNELEPNRLYRNDNGMLTSAAVWSSVEADDTHSVAWGDYDGDGFLDLAVGNDGPNRLYLNNGGVLSTRASWSSETDNTSSVAWGDYDNDGDLDLAVGNRFQPNRLYRNDHFPGSTPQFTQVWFPTETYDTTSLAWGDYDGDGDLDLAVGNWGGPNRLYRNDAGVLTSSGWSSADPDNNTTSLAWGDYDGDGDLDLAAGNWNLPNRLYRNDGGTLTTGAAWSSNETDNTTSIAWGDYDNDGDLDLGVGNSDQPKRIYRNEGSPLSPSPILGWNPVSNPTRSIAWGDVDNDGDLDLAVGNYQQINLLYYNNNGTIASSPAWGSLEADYTTSVAWGDYDNDGYLDLAVGNAGQPNRLYHNDGGVLSHGAVWSSTESDDTTSLAWGDYDGDGDLDLAVGNYGQPNRLYRNDGIVGGVPLMTLVWSSDETDWTRSIAWGDYDGDGDLDLAVGNYGQPNRLYRNEGGMLTSTAVWSSNESDNTTSVAWGDYDGDGDLDLAVGNYGQPNRLYRNEGGMLTSTAVWSSTEWDYTNSVAWGDYNGDGFLDLAVGNYGFPNRVYRNEGGELSRSAIWSSVGSPSTYSLAWGDYDNDGDLDLAAGNDAQTNRLYNNGRDVRSLPGSVPVVSVTRPGSDADLYSLPQTWSNPIIPITYTLSDPQSSPISFVRAWYSTDGGGHWLEAVAASGTITTDLATSPSGVLHVYNWDVFASRFFGNSDDVVFRLQAVPGIVNYPDQAPGPYLHGSYASSTYPFRVRGSQVRVYQESVAPGNQVPGAFVFRLPAGQGGQAEPIADLAGVPFHTDNQGYLQGKGELGPGDQLVALLPVIITDSYTLYATSAVPTASGLDMYTVSTSGVQNLTVSTNHSLVLFNLSVSLEWDARLDTRFMEELHYGVQRASELLYDWTNGQAAIGEVTLYHNRQLWYEADVRIYASNHRRPAATLGGIVDDDVTDPVNSTLVYQPGMVHIGMVWNRYGEPGGSIGEDWPRALAHELGHYALFMDDDYLGLDAEGHLILVNTCTGTAMTDPYRDDYSEFKTPADWLPGCKDVLANKTTRRADWDTVSAFYPTLSGASLNPGPSRLPLAVTHLHEVEPLEDPRALSDPRFYLKDAGGASLAPGRETRAFLMRGDEADPDARLVDLGRPAVDSILAPGAQPGDRLCVIELDEQRTGCKTITASDDQQLTLAVHPSWQPEVRVSPVTSRTVEVEVENLGLGLSLLARLYPGSSSASEVLTLVEAGDTYIGTFNLVDPAIDGYVRIWVDEPNSQQEVVVDFAMGGNPARMRSGFARMRSGFARMRSGFAPATSSDGHVILYSEQLEFPEGEFYTFQAATLLPNPPPWATVIGQAYWLTQSGGAPSLSGTSLDMGYMEPDVPAGEESWIKIYRWDDEAGEWVALATTVNTTENSAFAVIPGSGLYVLMSTIEIPLYGPGWDQFAYPVQAVRPITDALVSIEGAYNTVYRFDGSDPLDNWKVFSPDVPSWVNDLTNLQFGEGYWIHLTKSIILKLQGAGFIDQTQAPAQQLPPATYYGPVLPTENFKPSPGMEVFAWTGGVKCGQGRTQLVNGQVVYSINVSADGSITPGCGKAGSVVHFQVGDYKMVAAVSWNTDRVWYVPLSTRGWVYLPMLYRR
jgi:hypothetical protein